MRPQMGVPPVASTDAVRYVDLAVRSILQGAIPFVEPPSSYFQNNGVIVLGQRPASSATVTFSATSGSGVTATFSAATLAGSASDVGRVVPILDTTYKFFTITGNSGSSTTICQGTISGGTLSTVGAFANSAIWLSNNPTGSIAGYATPLPRVVGNSYSYFPTGAISSGSTAGWYWTNWSSTTVGQVYNNGYSTGTPTVQSAPTAFVSTGPGAFTQTSASYIQGPKATLAGNSFGLNGSIESAFFISAPANTNNKLASMFLGTTRIGQIGVASAANLMSGGLVSLSNQGATNAQVATRGNASYGGDFALGVTINTLDTFSFDTTAAQSVGFQQQNSVATDYNILERYSMKIYPTTP